MLMAPMCQVCMDCPTVRHVVLVADAIPVLGDTCGIKVRSYVPYRNSMQRLLSHACQCDMSRCMFCSSDEQ